MSGNSKSEMIDSLIRRHVRDAINDLVVNSLNDEEIRHARWLMRNANLLCVEVAARATRTYAMIELTDIIQWKKRAS